MPEEATFQGVHVNRKGGANQTDINQIRRLCLESNPPVGPGPAADSLGLPLATVLSFIEHWSKRLGIEVPEWTEAQLATTDPAAMMAKLDNAVDENVRLRELLAQAGIDPDEVAENAPAPKKGGGRGAKPDPTS